MASGFHYVQEESRFLDNLGDRFEKSGSKLFDLLKNSKKISDV